MGVSADGRDRWFCYVAHIQEEQVGLGDGVNSLLRCAAAGCWRGEGAERERGGGPSWDGERGRAKGEQAGRKGKETRAPRVRPAG
jgi:hypothetical protein